MAGRERTTKARARRIDREYFRRTFAFQRWRWILTIASAALALLWLGLSSAAHSVNVYSAGPLTPAHAILNQKCTVCHVRVGAFSASVTDQACSVCHDGAVHQATQAFTPRCVECHEEHTSTPLTAVRDRQCTICHGALKTKSGPLKVAGVIHSFTTDHPEFSPQRLNAVDPGTIKFNHAVHLKKDLRAPHGTVKLACSDCHRADNHESWPWGKADENAASSSGRKYMEPVNYAKHCSTCHPLTFDLRFSEPAPHQDPAIVHDFLVRKFTAWFAAHPEDLRGKSDADIRIPGAQEPPRNAAASVANAERLLRVKTCKECHDIATVETGLPPIAKAKVTPRWLPRGEFDHSAHQMLLCAGCHPVALASTKTTDVLLPGIAVCRECHVSGKQDAARATCVECHIYHDPAMHKHVDGKFTAHQISALH